MHELGGNVITQAKSVFVVDGECRLKEGEDESIKEAKRKEHPQLGLFQALPHSQKLIDHTENCCVHLVHTPHHTTQ